MFPPRKIIQQQAMITKFNDEVNRVPTPAPKYDQIRVSFESPLKWRIYENFKTNGQGILERVDESEKAVALSAECLDFSKDW